MGDLSRLGNEIEGRESGGTEHSSACSVCDGKGYTLATSRKVNQTQTIFERQDCPHCRGTVNAVSSQRTNDTTSSGRKRLSGTGYLRNKKRRRKDDDQKKTG